MADNKIQLRSILDQAPKWTFAGDSTLLQWMIQISEILAFWTSKTIEGLTVLDSNVRSTNIALDNMANGMTALQFGNQFVECRVKDDDEILSNANLDNPKQPKQNVISKEMLYTFLNNNIEVLRNCHEKHPIDWDDSDDDENIKEKTYIYKPINPCNNRHLPFIFGSKDWHSMWHVGLCENQQETSYSGDEIFDACSESSSSSHLADNESFESNTELVSSISICNDFNLSTKNKNVSSLRVSPVKSLSITDANVKTTISESSSIYTKPSLASTSLQTENENLSEQSENINSSKTQPQTFLNLITEPTEDLKSTLPSVYSAQSIVPNDNITASKEIPSVLRTQPSSFVNVFAEPPECVLSTTSSMSSKQNIKPKAVNLFDVDDHNIATDDLLSVFTKNDEIGKLNSEKHKILSSPKFDVGSEPAIISKISKSPFDDGEDDDFVNIFGSKSLLTGATTTSLQDDIYNAKKSASIESVDGNSYYSNKIRNVFDAKDNENDLVFNSTTKDEYKTSIQNSSPHSSLLSKPTEGEHVEKLGNVLNDFDNVPKIHNLKSAQILKKLNQLDENRKQKNNNDIPRRMNITKREISCSRKQEEKSFEDLKDSTSTTDVGSITVRNQVFYNSKIQKDNVPNDKDNMSEESVSQEHVIDRREITKNKSNTQPIGMQNELPTLEKLFKPPQVANDTKCLEDLNRNNSILITHDKLATFSENSIQKPKLSNKYEFNSILLLNEPPEDDRDIFDRLSKTANTFISNYCPTDLENDIYEPDLPKVHFSRAKNNQPDTSENLYTSLQLFSDVPPDDYADNSDTSVIIPEVNKTKCLNNIFYDDFNETLTALNQIHTNNNIFNNSVFTDALLSINEEVSTVSRDEICHKVPDCKQNASNAYGILGCTGILKKADDENANKFSNNATSANSQMSHICMDARSLLPEANSTLRKFKENTTKQDSINVYDDKKLALNFTKGIISNNCEMNSKLHITEEFSFAGSEHILPNLNKNRVKASSARRPSTRRARQESYRKSLIEQQQIFKNGVQITEIENECSNEIYKSMQIQTKESILEMAAKVDALEIKKDDLGIRDISPKFSESCSLFKNNKNPDNTLLHIRNVDDSLTKFKQIENTCMKKKNLWKQKNVSFYLEDEGDDDLINYIKTSQIVNTNIASKSKDNKENETIKSFFETNEVNPSNSSENIRVSPSLKANYSDIVVQGTKYEFEKQQPSKGDECMFNKPHINAIAQAQTSNQLTSNKSNIFSDNDDDLFKTILQQIPTPIHSTSVSSSKIGILYENSESDGDELIGRLSTEISSKKCQPRSPLFGRDTENENFLTSNTYTKRNPKKTTAFSTNFFCGLDSDEDDLFNIGATSAKTANVTPITKVIPLTTTKVPESEAEVSKLETADDNPLADLL